MDKPLSLAATLVFEQNYGGVVGDSAYCAELCTLLSAMAVSPLRQSFPDRLGEPDGDVQESAGLFGR